MATQRDRIETSRRQIAFSHSLSTDILSKRIWRDMILQNGIEFVLIRGRGIGFSGNVRLELMHFLYENRFALWVPAACPFLPRDDWGIVEEVALQEFVNLMVETGDTASQEQQGDVHLLDTGAVANHSPNFRAVGCHESFGGWSSHAFVLFSGEHFEHANMSTDVVIPVSALNVHGSTQMETACSKRRATHDETSELGSTPTALASTPAVNTNGTLNNECCMANVKRQFVRRLWLHLRHLTLFPEEALGMCILESAHSVTSEYCMDVQSIMDDPLSVICSICLDVVDPEGSYGCENNISGSVWAHLSLICPLRSSTASTAITATHPLASRFRRGGSLSRGSRSSFGRRPPNEALLRVFSSCLASHSPVVWRGRYGRTANRGLNIVRAASPALMISTAFSACRRDVITGAPTATASTAQMTSTASAELTASTTPVIVAASTASTSPETVTAPTANAPSTAVCILGRLSQLATCQRQITATRTASSEDSNQSRRMVLFSGCIGVCKLVMYLTAALVHQEMPVPVYITIRHEPGAESAAVSPTEITATNQRDWYAFRHLRHRTDVSDCSCILQQAAYSFGDLILRSLVQIPSTLRRLDFAAG
uniref:Uncharacterized protein n=1 Tax=Ditylenchus dipsaci TaxID=166011 RepID=A0A915EGM8_9BILA